MGPPELKLHKHSTVSGTELTISPYTLYLRAVRLKHMYVWIPDIHNKTIWKHCTVWVLVLLMWDHFITLCGHARLREQLLELCHQDNWVDRCNNWIWGEKHLSFTHLVQVNTRTFCTFYYQLYKTYSIYCAVTLHTIHCTALGWSSHRFCPCFVYIMEYSAILVGFTNTPI